MRLIVFLAVCLFPGLGSAEGLMGREVTFQVLTYEDPSNPLFEGAKHKSVVSDQIEFGLDYEGEQNELDVIPVVVEITANRMEFSYVAGTTGDFWDAPFNGYVIDFQVGCALLKSARIDWSATTMDLEPSDISVRLGRVEINVAGLSYDALSSLAIDFELTDCVSA